MAVNKLLISLVITTYNRAELLAEALASVARSRVEDSSRIEVIVVDNNSTDNTEETVDRIRKSNFPFQLKYVQEPNQGLSHARNRGIQESNGTYIVFMDDDQVIDTNYLARVGPAFEETQAACMGGTVFHLDADNMPAWLAPLLARSVNGCDQSAESDRMRVLAPGGNEHLVGGNMAFRRQDLLAVGGYDVRLGRRGDFLLAGEDFELQDRLHALGKKIVFHPKLIQYHHLHPERQTRRYWRKLAFFQGRTFYLRDMSARLQRSSRLFHAPRWLWWCLVAKDLPRYAKSRFVLDSSERFSGELQLWRRSGQIYEARLERKATGKNEWK